MASIKAKNPLALILLLLAGIIVGGFLTELTKDISWLSWLSFGKEFGLDMQNPFVLDLSVIKLKFACMFKLDIATIIGVCAAFFAYRKWF